MTRYWVLGAFCLAAAAAWGAAPIGILVNGRQIKTDQPPRLIGAKVYLPVRATAEAVGGDVQWHPKTKQAVICRGKRCLPVSVARDQAKLFDGRVFLPLRRLAQGLGLKVKWDPKQRIVSITGPPAAQPVPGLKGPGQ